MKPQTLDDSHTMADLWSDLYQTWTRTLFSAWKLADTSDRKGAELSAPAPAEAGFYPWQAALDYWVDASQRTVLFWDALRQRSQQYYAEKAKAAPHVLSFDAELLLDGRTFERPVNYGLARIKPPQGVVIDPEKRPFVVVDPRAGHGPGIGGFKADSELGVAMRAGHPCYFVGFTPDPMPGQTIEDIMCAEAVFLEQVIALHPGADGKPCVIGNCQAGDVDERAFNQLRQIRAAHDDLTLEEFKRMLREQFFALMLDPDGALAAIPKMVSADAGARREALAAIRAVVSAAGELTGERAERLARIEVMLGEPARTLAPHA